MTVINSSKSTHNWDCKAEESLVSDDNSRVKKMKNEKKKMKKKNEKGPGNTNKTCGQWSLSQFDYSHA